MNALSNASPSNSPSLRFRLHPSLRLLLAMALAGAAGLAAAEPRYAVTSMGVLAGYASCMPKAINNLGQVVGSCMPAVEDYAKQRAFLWQSGNMAALGLMKRGSFSVATSINGNGVAVGDGNVGGSARPQGWVRKGNSLDEFFPNNGGNTHAVFMSDSGWIGGYTVSGFTSNPWVPAVWAPDPKDPRKYRQTILPSLPVASGVAVTQTIAESFNQAGQAVGHTLNDAIGQRAIFWNSNAQRTPVDLGLLPGDSASMALALNDLGQAVGMSYSGSYSRAVMWLNNPARTLVALAPLAGDNGGSAHAINNLGHVLGHSYLHKVDGTPSTPARPVLWRDGVAYPLQALLDAASGSDWLITSATALNQRGQIVGTATRAGQRHAVVLTPLN